MQNYRVVFNGALIVAQVASSGFRTRGRPLCDKTIQRPDGKFTVYDSLNSGCGTSNTLARVPYN